MQLFKKIFRNCFHRFLKLPRNRIMPVFGLISLNGPAGFATFEQRFRTNLPAVLAAWNDARACDNGALAAAVVDFLAKTVTPDIVDENYRACTGGGIFKNSFTPIRLVQLLAMQCTKGVEPYLFTQGLLASSPNSFHFLLAHSRLLQRHDPRKAADAALAAWQLNNYDLCAVKQLSATQKTLSENGKTCDIEITTQDFSDRFCEMPFSQLMFLDVPGKTGAIAVNPCVCIDWLPLACEDDLSWNSPALQEVRRSILNGDYRYCDEMRCPFLREGTLPKRSEVSSAYYRSIIDNAVTFLPKGPSSLVLGYDKTCNLSCPSCRPSVYVNDKATSQAFDARMEQVLPPLLPFLKSLSLSGCGEALASAHSLRILRSITPSKYPDLKVNLLTNLALFKQVYESLGESATSIKSLHLSIDGATPATLEKLRRGLKWSRMIEALQFAKELREEGKLEFLRMASVIQKDNYKEMKDLILLASKYSIDELHLMPITYHGSYTAQEFQKINIFNASNEHYEDFLHERSATKILESDLKKSGGPESGTIPKIVWRI